MDFLSWKTFLRKWQWYVGFHKFETPNGFMQVGAGYIAVELAGMLQTLGSDVSLVIRHSEFLRTFDVCSFLFFFTARVHVLYSKC